MRNNEDDIDSVSIVGVCVVAMCVLMIVLSCVTALM